MTDIEKAKFTAAGAPVDSQGHVAQLHAVEAGQPRHPPVDC